MGSREFRPTAGREDGLGARLIAWSVNGTQQQTWSLDALGNDLSAGTYSAANEEDPTVGSSGYDAAGNMTTLKSGDTATYDAWDRLARVLSGETILQYNQYDGTNRRIRIYTDFTGSTPGMTQDDYLRGQQVVETRENGATKYHTLWSPRYIDSPVYRDTLANDVVDPNARCFYLSDANYNVTSLLTWNPNTLEWSITERYTYTPYGVVTYRLGNWSTTGSSARSNTILYTGRTLDLATNLFYYRARYYDAVLERFVGRDPAKSDPNLCRYVYNTPLIATDPYGLWIELDVPLDAWKAFAVAQALDFWAVGPSRGLLGHWMEGTGKAMDVPFWYFDGPRVLRSAAVQETRRQAEAVGATLKTGETRTGLNDLPKPVKSNTSNPAVPMILGFRFWYESSYTVTKKSRSVLGLYSICELDIVALFTFHAMDTVDFWPTAGEVFLAPPYLIHDRLVRELYPTGRGFTVSNTQNEQWQWTIPIR